jgi:hypothetical protein
MEYAPRVMRRRSVDAVAAHNAAFALIGLPVPVGSRSPSPSRDLRAAAFTTLTIPANTPAPSAPGALDPAFRADGFLGDLGLVEPGSAPKPPTRRPSVALPAVSSGSAWKKPLYTLSGYASFYDNGTTAMRLPAGTVVRVCAPGGCLVRTVDDYGPKTPSRVIDMFRPDFFAICGCASWAGLVMVTVSVY